MTIQLYRTVTNTDYYSFDIEEQDAEDFNKGIQKYILDGPAPTLTAEDLCAIWVHHCVDGREATAPFNDETYMFTYKWDETRHYDQTIYEAALEYLNDWLYECYHDTVDSNCEEEEFTYHFGYDESVPTSVQEVLRKVNKDENE
jgi:hypothetical protein